MLAKLASDNHISGIVTTNFDTLIEKAFLQKGVPFTEYSTVNDYLALKEYGGIPIHKIHGSAKKAIYAIDTAQQKLQGFSGEDFLFGTDFILIRVSKDSKQGIY